MSEGFDFNGEVARIEREVLALITEMGQIDGRLMVVDERIPLPQRQEAAVVIAHMRARVKLMRDDAVILSSRLRELKDALR